MSTVMASGSWRGWHRVHGGPGIGLLARPGPSLEGYSRGTAAHAWSAAARGA